MLVVIKSAHTVFSEPLTKDSAKPDRLIRSIELGRLENNRTMLMRLATRVAAVMFLPCITLMTFLKPFLSQEICVCVLEFVLKVAFSVIGNYLQVSNAARSQRWWQERLNFAQT